jgi:hypothetical protein
MSDGELEFNGFSRKKFTYENEDDQIIITGEK